MAAEVVLTAIGMDDMADYCEYRSNYPHGFQVVLAVVA